MNIDFATWGVVGFKDSTGLGRMAAAARDVLGVGRHLVFPSERLTNEKLDPATEVALTRESSDEELKRALQGLEGLLVLERAHWSQELLWIARDLKVKVVAIPMWEWFRGDDPLWEAVDFFACPNQFALETVRSYRFERAEVLRWPVNWRRFPERKISGPARVFVHNAGLIDVDDRKGTRETIEAFMQVRRSDLKLIVRMQNEVELPAVDERVELRFGNLRNAGDLYREGDVVVQPSKMEGIGFMVLEAVCAGLPVITTDYAPMNEWVRDVEMRCATQWRNRRAFATQWVKQAHLRLPSVPDLARRIEWSANNDLEKFSRGNRKWAEENLDPESLREQWREALGRVF